MKLSFLLLFGFLFTFEAYAQQAQNPKPCYARAEHRQFDFWLGEWQVTNAQGQPAGLSKIELILDGCVILENWTSAQAGYVGKSMNYYDRVDGKWHQTWIDNAGVPIVFEGNYSDEEKAMLYTAVTLGPNGEKVLNKLSFYFKNKNYVNQVWEQSADEGKTWNIVFDGHYKRKI